MNAHVTTLKHPIWLDISQEEIEEQEVSYHKKEKHMQIIKDKTLTFYGVRRGTVFGYKDDVYIKTKEDTAVNLNDGTVISKEDSLQMTSCIIYPRASIKLA